MPVQFQTNAAAAAVGRQEISATDAQKVEQVAASAVALAQSMQSLGGVPDVFEVIGDSTQVKQLSQAVSLGSWWWIMDPRFLRPKDRTNRPRGRSDGLYDGHGL